MSRPVLHVERAGSGIPLVLTHGFGDDSATWDGVRAGLLGAGGIEVSTWDLLGHGRSPRPAGDEAYSRDAAVDALARIVATSTGPGAGSGVGAGTGGGPAGSTGGLGAVLVGHSLGGFLSLAVAIRRPELVTGLVLIATGPGFRDTDARERWNSYARSAAADFAVPPVAVSMVLQPDSFVIDRLREIEVPVLQIVGGRDTRYHAGVSYIERVLPSVVTVHVEGAGHHVHVTHTAEVVEAIRTFLPTTMTLPGDRS